MFTQEEDRHLLCWAHKFGYGNWAAIKFAIRRSHTFRMDYFLKALPIDAIGRRCEQLMKAAEKEVEQLEKEARDEETSNGGSAAQQLPLRLPTYKEMMERKKKKKQEEIKNEEARLENNVQEIEFQIKVVQDRMKMIEKDNSEKHYKNHNNNVSVKSESEFFPDRLVSELADHVAQGGSTGLWSLASKFVDMHPDEKLSTRQVGVKIDEIAAKEKRGKEGELSWYIKPAFLNLVSTHGGISSITIDSNIKHKVKKKKRKDKTSTPDNAELVPFPEYDGSEPPKERKKAFTLFCNATRKEVKSSLDAIQRKDKVNRYLVHALFHFTNY